MSKNLYKKLFILLALVGLANGLMAKHIEPSQARHAATQYAILTGLKIDHSNPEGLTDITTSTPFREFYIFSGNDGNGFVIVSGDDCVTPILGYSDDTPFVGLELPDHILAWLTSYEEGIRYHREQQIPATDSISRLWSNLLSDTPAPIKAPLPQSVAPLLTTRWNQAPLYNSLCPIAPTDANGNRSVTGCVATAMAQIMKYWDHPTQGTGSKSYSLSGFGTISADFGNTTYDWNNMPNALTSSSTATQIEAVATLMYHAGVSVSMMYGALGSGAYDIDVPTALKTYFGYQQSLNLISKSNFSDDEWKAIIRNELSSTPGHPLYYRGDDGHSGHAFVCDGYSRYDLYHFNWGWNGSCDGYYIIGNLNPGTSGIGASASNSYNLSNQIIVNLIPRQDIPSDNNGILTIQANDDTYGTVTGESSGTYPIGSTHTVTATPNSGHRFLCWSDGKRTLSNTFTLNDPEYTLTAIFDNLGDDTKGYSLNSTSGNSTDVTCWAITLPTSAIERYTYLDAVQLYIATAGTYTVNLYRDNTTGTPIHSQSLTATSSHCNKWNTIPLTSPVSIADCSSLWIVFNRTNGSACYSRTTGNSDGAKKGGPSSWSNFTSGTWMIRGHFTQNTNPCPPVGQVTVSDITDSSATIHWNQPTTGTPTNYTIAYGTGNIPDLMAIITTSELSATLTPLNASTQYNVYVQANYGDEHSTWIQSHFSTPSSIGASNTIVINANSNDPNMGFVDGAGTYSSGSRVTLTAIPAVGCQFAQWQDGNTDNPRTITANSNATYTATFQQALYHITISSTPGGGINIQSTNDYTYGNGVSPVHTTALSSSPPTPLRDTCSTSGATPTPPTLAPLP